MRTDANSVSVPAAPRRAQRIENRAEHTLRDPRWTSVKARARAADGTFFYSVRTTGVYCRPSCVARTPRPENVEFHATREDAERAGFRACRRCKPDRAGDAAVGVAPPRIQP